MTCHQNPGPGDNAQMTLSTFISSTTKNQITYHASTFQFLPMVYDFHEQLHATTNIILIWFKQILEQKSFKLIIYIQHKNITWHAINQSSGYDIYRRHAVLCIVVVMTSTDVTHVSKYSIVHMMPVSNGNLYVVFARCSSYFRVWQEVVDCLTAVLGLSSFD
jgi:hypothetical protein